MTRYKGFEDWEIVDEKVHGYSWDGFDTRGKAAKILYDDTQDVWNRNCSDGVLERSATRIYTSGVVHTLSLTASSVILCPGEQQCGSFVLGDLIRRATAVAGLPLAAAEELFCHRVYTLATKGRLETLSEEFTVDDHDIFANLFDRLSNCYDDILEKLHVRHLEVVETWS